MVQSEAQALRFVENVSDCLKPGGLFIATTPDSNTLLSQLRARYPLGTVACERELWRVFPCSQGR